MPDPSFLLNHHINLNNQPKLEATPLRTPIDRSNFNHNLSFEVSNSSYLDDSFRSIDYWTDYANQPHCHYIYEYEGLQGMLYKQVKKFANRYFRAEVRNYWNNSYLSPMDLDRRIRDYNLRANEYQWWDRPWYDSLPIEKGGMQSIRVQVGHEHKVLSMGPLNLDNTGHFDWSGWDFRVTPRSDVNYVNRNIDVNELTEEQLLQREDDRLRALELGISPPITDIRHEDNWRLRSSVSFNFKINGMDMTNNGSSIRFGLEFTGMYSQKHIPWIVIRAECAVKPLRQEYQAELNISLLNF